MTDNYQTEKFLRTIESMEDTDLMLTYKNCNDYNLEFVELLVEEVGIRGYDATEIEKMSLADIDISVIKNKKNIELVKIYYKQGNFKAGWDTLAKEELKNRGIDVEKQTDEKTSIFNRCFSFSGRIRRLEYGLSVIITSVYTVVVFVGLFLNFAFPYPYELMLYILLIPAYWFIFSQGARRCYDLGYNGWWQLIPFYSFVMLFADGDLGRNEYGENPKGKGNFLY